MNNPLMQGVLARTAVAHGESLAADSSSGEDKNRAVLLKNGPVAEEQNWRDTKARTEQILNEVLHNFGGAKPGKNPAPAVALPAELVKRTNESAAKIVFVNGDAEESGYFTTEKPYRFGYRTSFPAHLLATLDKLELKAGRGLVSIQWEMAGTNLIVSGEASEPAQALLADLMREVQERMCQKLNYPGGSVEAQYYPQVGKHLAHFAQQELNWRTGAGEAIGYLESQPPVFTVAYRGMFATSGTFAWQGNRLWVKGASPEVEKFLREAVPWILEQGELA